MNWTRLLGSKEPRRERCQQFIPALITAISLCPGGSIRSPGQIYSLHNPNEGNEVVPWMNLMSWSRLLCSWQDVSICLARLPCLSQTTLLDPTWFLMEDGGKGLCHHWGCILCTPENPGDKICWKGSDCYWGNHAVISHGESWVGAHLLATWYMEGICNCVVVWGSWSV